MALPIPMLTTKPATLTPTTTKSALPGFAEAMSAAVSVVPPAVAKPDTKPGSKREAGAEPASGTKLKVSEDLKSATIATTIPAAQQLPTIIPAQLSSQYPVAANHSADSVLCAPEKIEAGPQRVEYTAQTVRASAELPQASGIAARQQQVEAAKGDSAGPGIVQTPEEPVDLPKAAPFAGTATHETLASAPNTAAKTQADTSMEPVKPAGTAQLSEAKPPAKDFAVAVEGQQLQSHPALTSSPNPELPITAQIASETAKRVTHPETAAATPSKISEATPEPAQSSATSSNLPSHPKTLTSESPAIAVSAEASAVLAMLGEVLNGAGAQTPAPSALMDPTSGQLPVGQETFQTVKGSGPADRAAINGTFAGTLKVADTLPQQVSAPVNKSIAPVASKQPPTVVGSDHPNKIKDQGAGPVARDQQSSDANASVAVDRSTQAHAPASVARVEAQGVVASTSLAASVKAAAEPVHASPQPEATAVPVPATEMPPAPSVPSLVNSAKLIQSISGSEMRLGMHSADLGSVSIKTSVGGNQLAVDIAVEHPDLGSAILKHLPVLEAKLASDHGVQTQIQIGQGSTSFNGGFHSRPQDQQPQQHGAAQKIAGNFAAQDSAKSFVTPSSRAQAAASDRLDVQA